MTRPKKEETLAKTKDVHLRMNETEYDLLAERAKANSMTVSDFVRSALDNQKVIIKYEITADVPEIKKLISEFGKIGSNLNQIVRYFNQGGILSSLCFCSKSNVSSVLSIVKTPPAFLQNGTQ